MQSLEGPENGHYACSDQTQGEKDERAVSCEESAEKTGRLGGEKEKEGEKTERADGQRKNSCQPVREAESGEIAWENRGERKRTRI